VGRHLVAGVDIGIHCVEPAPQAGGGAHIGRGGQGRSFQQLASQLWGSTAPGDAGCPFQLSGDRLIRGDDRPRTVAGTLDRVIEIIGKNAVRATTLGRCGGVINGRSQQRVSESNHRIGADDRHVRICGIFQGRPEPGLLNDPLQLRHGEPPRRGHQQQDLA
jgi:hypothetical protein